jgi:NAD(P)-dependent dehydrogenase (short-subunit alcohol dehydrogenase family)
MIVTSMQSLSTGYRALVIGASGGIGQALVETLSRDSRAGEVVGLSRSIDGLELENESTVQAHASKLRDQTFQMVVCATGALTIDGRGPEKSIRQIDHETMIRQFSTNAVGPALVLKHFLPLLDRKARSIFIILSARVGSIGDNRLGGWISYRSSKAALNQIVKTASIELARTHPNCVLVALHPGTVATALSAPFPNGRQRFAPLAASNLIVRTADNLLAEHSGGFFAYDGSEIVW